MILLFVIYIFKMCVRRGFGLFVNAKDNWPYIFKVTGSFLFGSVPDSNTMYTDMLTCKSVTFQQYHAQYLAQYPL